MASRLKLHEELCELLNSRNVYFQPPESIKLKYPCIIYSRRPGEQMHADNLTYFFKHEYELLYITRDPDDPIVDKLLLTFPMIRHDRFYTSDNLNHDSYTLYY